MAKREIPKDLERALQKIWTDYTIGRASMLAHNPSALDPPDALVRITWNISIVFPECSIKREAKKLLKAFERSAEKLARSWLDEHKLPQTEEAVNFLRPRLAQYLLEQMKNVSFVAK